MSQENNNNTVESTFIPQTVVRIMSTASFNHADTKISATALKASIEYLRVFTREAIWRSEEYRRALEGEESTGDLTVANLEAVAANLVLDF